MTDPMSVLRIASDLRDPDPRFARRLRLLLEQSLRPPEGETMSPTTETSAQPMTIIPYLAVHGAREALDWYVDVFDARIEGDPIVMPDGRIGHSELHIGAAVVYLAEEHPEIGVVAPARGAATVSLMLPVEDADATLMRAEQTGGRRDREPYDGHGQRTAWMIDPFGHRWGLNSPLRG